MEPYENMEPTLLSYKESLRQGASVAGASPPVYLHVFSVKIVRSLKLVLTVLV